MFKTFGILLLSCVPVLIGIKKSNLINEQKQHIEAFLYFVRECRQEIEFQQRSITDIIGHLPSNNYRILNQLTLTIRDSSPSAAWNRISHHVEPDTALIMNDFFNHWGNSDCRSQLQICDITVKRLEQLHDKFSTETVKKMKLYRTIGVLAGAFIAIIFI